MNTTKPKTKRTDRRKTDISPLDESINQYVDAILANGQGSPNTAGSLFGNRKELFQAPDRGHASGRNAGAFKRDTPND